MAEPKRTGTGNDRIDRLNEILESIVLDAKDLTRDLSSGIFSYLVLGLITMVFGIQFAYYTFYRLGDIGVVPMAIFLLDIVFGSFFIANYFRLRSKYRRIFDIEREMERI